MELQITRAILHILDTNADVPVYSQQELKITEDEIQRFITTHVRRIFEDKAARTGEAQTQAIGMITEMKKSFIEGSIAVADRLFELMKKHVDIPSGDLLIAHVENNLVPYLAIMKLNYKEGYTHFVDYGESGVNNQIIVHRVLFASESQRIEEGVLIHLNDYSMKVIEKAAEIDGEKRNYFSELFLRCRTNLSEKESIKIINHVAKEISKKYYNDDFEKATIVKSAIYDNLGDDGSIDIEVIAETTFSDNHQLKKEYIEKVKEAGVESKVTLSGDNPEKNFSKYKIKMENGIELNIPIDVYRNKNEIEFINNPDGTISIIIKQARKIRNV